MSFIVLSGVQGTTKGPGQQTSVTCWGNVRQIYRYLTMLGSIYNYQNLELSPKVNRKPVQGGPVLLDLVSCLAAAFCTSWRRSTDK